MQPEAYSGQRTAPGIVDFALSAAKKVVKARMSGKKSGSSKSKSSKSKSGSKSKSSGNAVVDLTEDDFKEQVLNDKSIWMVEFFAPWCGHCKKLAPEWKDAANKLKGKVKLGAVDCTVHKGVCSKYGVRGYPTIKVFGANKKKPTKYEQARTSGAIVSHALSLYADSAVAPDVHELVDQKVFDEECASSGLCVVAFLPHILDSGAVGRNGYIKLMEGLAEKFKMDPFTYIWAQGYDHPELESAINVGGAGYPALAVINKKKQRAAKFSGAFTESNISSFLQGIFSGRERTHSITLKGSFITTVAKWDGKDGKVVEEEDWEDDHDEL